MTDEQKYSVALILSVVLAITVDQLLHPPFLVGMAIGSVIALFTLFVIKKI
jgi:hypothetical protein